VSLGTLWTFGLAGFWGLPLDLFGLAVLPILLGIGIDDGLHALHGSRRQLPTSDGVARGVVDSVEGAGRAMALTTLTTVVGFLSLGVSRIPALRAGGLLIALGVLCCLAATFVVLPALEAFFEKKNS
jgi:predicted RND superfamily exporter protein